MINDWLNTISIVTNEQMRETLYNIEQFRADVLNLASLGNGVQGQRGGVVNTGVKGASFGS